MGKGKKCLLVVSSDLEILRALSKALTWMGYAVGTAMDWSDVPGRLRCLSVSAILYDIKELDREKWGRLEALRKAYPDLSVVLLSSLESPALARAVDGRLITGYLLKPIHLTTLEQTLARVVPSDDS